MLEVNISEMLRAEKVLSPDLSSRERNLLCSSSGPPSHRDLRDPSRQTSFTSRDLNLASFLSRFLLPTHLCKVPSVQNIGANQGLEKQNDIFFLQGQLVYAGSHFCKIVYGPEWKK